MYLVSLSLQPSRLLTSQREAGVLPPLILMISIVKMSTWLGGRVRVRVKGEDEHLVKGRVRVRVKGER